VYASEDYPVDISRPENLVAWRLRDTRINVPSAGLNYAVTAMDRFGQESEATQIQLNTAPEYNATIIPKSDGSPVALPQNDNPFDADFIIIETLMGQQMAVVPFAPRINVASLPDGIYQLRSLGSKGRNHRIGFFSKKTQRRQ
jgi:hypothetical protein